VCSYIRRYTIHDIPPPRGWRCGPPESSNAHPAPSAASSGAARSSPSVVRGVGIGLGICHHNVHTEIGYTYFSVIYDIPRGQGLDVRERSIVHGLVYRDKFSNAHLAMIPREAKLLLLRRDHVQLHLGVSCLKRQRLISCLRH